MRQEVIPSCKAWRFQKLADPSGVVALDFCSSSLRLRVEALQRLNARTSFMGMPTKGMFELLTPTSQLLR